MSDTIITADRLGKAYRLGMKIDRNATFRDAIMHAVRSPIQRLRSRLAEPGSSADTFWAIKDISFEVQRGQVIGFIGRNGAGKSTLLKVLSRITEPTEGRAILRGRVASLLEVGTGFHPELSGRENIYLNGAILGMRKAEIDRKFDEIVAFAEISKFLDTQVKRYSSGMYVRLAFAVAAHLEPEILIVDEVLAVGDANFQKKCLGKMSDVVRDGRTILFVSHNMDAVLNLCTQTMLINAGQISEPLTPDEGVKRYLALSNEGADLPLRQKPRFQRNRRHVPMIVGLRIVGSGGYLNVTNTGGPVTFEVELENFNEVRDAAVGIALTTERGQRVAFFHSDYHSQLKINGRSQATMTCHVPALPLVPNSYVIEVVLADREGHIERVERADRLDVVFSDLLGTGSIPNHHQGFVVWPATFTFNPDSRLAPQEPALIPAAGN